jgi:hypothetical protein
LEAPATTRRIAAALAFPLSTSQRRKLESMVLPAVDPKYRQLFKEIATMMYQIGLGARVFLN